MEMPNLPPDTEGFASVGWTGRLTVTVKPWVALRLGVPLSETTTLSTLVPDCEMAGRHVKMPLLGSIAAPGGGLRRLKVRTCGGESGSVALLVMLSVRPAIMVRLAIGESVG